MVSRPPTDHLPTTYQLPNHRPLTDHILTTYRPHTNHIQNTYQPLFYGAACSILPGYWTIRLSRQNGRQLHWPKCSCVSMKTKVWKLLLQPAVCTPSLIVAGLPEVFTPSCCVWLWIWLIVFRCCKASELGCLHCVAAPVQIIHHIWYCFTQFFQFYIYSDLCLYDT